MCLEASGVTAIPDYTPTLADIAAIIPSRAKGDFARLATFDSTTQPTGEQVQAIIDAEALALRGKIGEPAAALIDQAKRVLAYRVAAIVELTYFADQIRADRSPYNELKALYQEALADYITARANLGVDDTPGTADDQVPAYSFPPLGPLPHAPGSEIPCDAFGLDW